MSCHKVLNIQFYNFSQGALELMNTGMQKWLQVGAVDMLWRVARAFLNVAEDTPEDPTRQKWLLETVKIIFKNIYVSTALPRLSGPHPANFRALFHPIMISMWHINSL